MSKKGPTISKWGISYHLLVLFLLFFPLLSIFANERRPDISYSKQTLHILPELLLVKEIEPVEQIIFLHIPKTAGTNLDAIVSSVSQNKGGFQYQRLSVPRVSGRSPILITPDWIGGLKQLENDPRILEKISQASFLTGHFPYGLHLHFSKTSKYITLVRHPLERELSSANFDYQRGYIDANKFASYLTEQMIDNPQVRMIAGMKYMMGPCTEEILDIAKENIERDFILAAPSEDVDSFIQILVSMQKWGHVAYAPMQITRNKVIEKLDTSLTNALLQKHKWDLLLYEWVKLRWDLWKEKAILATKSLSSNEVVLTVMPDYITTRQAVLLTVFEIDAYNQKHLDSDFLQNKQK